MAPGSDRRWRRTRSRACGLRTAMICTAPTTPRSTTTRTCARSGARRWARARRGRLLRDLQGGRAGPAARARAHRRVDRGPRGRVPPDREVTTMPEKIQMLPEIAGNYVPLPELLLDLLLTGQLSRQELL